QIVAEDKSDVLLSAGNTGGLVLSAAKYIPMIEGVERGALATIFPVANFDGSGPDFSFLLDVGATIKCETKHLVHFAYMGQVYMESVFGLRKPKIGLLNIGSEDTKGGQVLRHTFNFLKESSEFNFIGNIEGSDILKGKADVIVCEGFTGNVLIKFAEGVQETLSNLGEIAAKKKITNKIALGLLSSGIKEVKSRMDYSEYGGAPILGFKKLCIKAHGKSRAKAIKNAVRVAVKSYQDEICVKIHDSIRKFNQKLLLSDNGGVAL
ncbi:phosphate acyltransferase PlsX, partial [candidate division KSB1 bacterium]